MASKIGYARVSTKEQTLELQRDELKKAGCEIIYEDKITGSSPKRPGLDNLIANLRDGEEVVVWRMDRLARGLAKLINIMSRIADKGCGVRSLSEPSLNTNGPQGKLVLHILGAVAEYELSLIKTRVREGIRHARENGKKFGRPNRLTNEQQKKIYASVSSKMITQAEASEIYNVGATTISRTMKKFREKNLLSEATPRHELL